MRSNSIPLLGQWVGHFVYGPEYGPEVFGEKVQFRLFIDNFNDGEFYGKSVDIEGIGANFEVAEVKGFVEGGFISFTKEYACLYILDENGRSVHDEKRPHPVVRYEGNYNSFTNSFQGDWELHMDIQSFGNGWLEDVCTGTWEIKKDD